MREHSLTFISLAFSPVNTILKPLCCIEQQSEQELQSAVAQVEAGLQELHVSDASAGAGATSADASSPSAASPDHSNTSSSCCNDSEASGATLPLQVASKDSGAAVARALPMPAIATWLVEYHRNIGCYHCYLFLDSGAAADSTSTRTSTSTDAEASSANGSSVYDRVDASQLAVCVAFPHVELRYSYKRTEPAQAATISDDTSDTLWWTTEIERNVEQASCVVSVKPDHIHVRLPVRAGDRDISADAFATFSQITAHELSVQHYRSIACRACANALVDAQAPAADSADPPPDSSERAAPVLARVLPLPSANWTDMFDFWGAGLGAFEHLPRDDILAQRARVYVGESHLLLHADDTVAAAFVQAQAQVQADDGFQSMDDRDAAWVPLACARCAAVLGMRHREHAETIRLDKHTLSSGVATRASPSPSPSPSDDIFARYTVDSVVCAKLLEVADADGVFRFTLRPSRRDGSSAASPAVLVLQLLSWETQVKGTDARAFRRVLKVLFAPDSSSQSHTHSHEDASGPVAAAAPHDVAVAPVVFDAVAARLRASSELLPQSLRTFNRMSVGYLYA